MSRNGLIDGLTATLHNLFSLGNKLGCPHTGVQACPSCIEGAAFKCSEEFFRRVLKDNESSEEQCTFSPSPTQTIFSENELKTEDSKILELDVSPSNNATIVDNGLPPQPKKWHRRTFTKEVPPAFALCMRGSLCNLCGHPFKGINCADKLVRHVTEVHKKYATTRYLEKVRRQNTVEAIIGKGMWYCDCSMCAR